MDHRTRAEILWGHLQRPGIQGNKIQEIECIIDALIDGAADALETRSVRDIADFYRFFTRLEKNSFIPTADKEGMDAFIEIFRPKKKDQRP